MIRRFALASTVLLCTAGRVQAKDAPSTPDPDSPSAVLTSEKSPVAAGLLEWVLPTLGYGYAGNWTRGIPPALVRITGWTLVASQQQSRFLDPNAPCDGWCAVGAVIAVGGTIWSVVDATRTASRENVRRRETILGTTVLPTLGPTGNGIGLRITFGF